MSITVERYISGITCSTITTRLVHRRLSLSTPFIPVDIKHHRQPLYCESGKTQIDLDSSTGLPVSGRSHADQLRYIHSYPLISSYRHSDDYQLTTTPTTQSLDTRATTTETIPIPRNDSVPVIYDRHYLSTNNHPFFFSH